MKLKEKNGLITEEYKKIYGIRASLGDSVDKSMVDNYIYINLISSVFDNFSFLDQLYSNIVDEITYAIKRNRK